MALTATIHTFDIQLGDVDRGVYETLALRVARHPSETEDYLFTRVLAYGLEYAEGIAFSKGLAEPDEPAIAVRDLTGALKVWVDIGAPDANRLHRASKAAARVAVYTHRDPAQLVRQLAGERIHRAEALELYAIDRALLAELVERLERRMSFALSVTGGHLYITIGDDVLDGAVERHALLTPGA
ncbi:MAG: YaeQ family protein [Gemmatimonadota bacterium]|nr:YaeQ family protein [Gemmatimonadota bacterium]